jgi:hypothetical protein
MGSLKCRLVVCLHGLGRPHRQAQTNQYDDGCYPSPMMATLLVEEIE